ncbi:hypothetical protein CLU81_4583 [Flavobacterium sp. 9]|nr:hypothetical protein CLU81_4583 [Flavobacterium sp. 9]
MIKTKTAFIIFLLLSTIIFPYYILVLSINSDFFNSIIPGWNTTIIPVRLISNLVKFIILSIVSFYYWKLSKTSNEIKLKKFIIHLALTIPAVVVAKLNLYELVPLNLNDSDIILSQIKKVVYINMLLNILFFIGQILFWIFYIKLQRTRIVIEK